MTQQASDVTAEMLNIAEEMEQYARSMAGAPVTTGEEGIRKMAEWSARMRKLLSTPGTGRRGKR
jgi:hypothetical protein